MNHPMPDFEPKLTEAQERAVLMMHDPGEVPVWFRYGAVRESSRATLLELLDLESAGIITIGESVLQAFKLTPLGVRIAERILERNKQ